MSEKINEIEALLEQKTQELQVCEAEFRATFNQAAAGIAHVGLDGRWLLLNQKFCDMVGYPDAELLNMNFQEITHPEDLPADLEHIRRLLADEIQHCLFEKRYIRKDGSVVWVNLSISLVRAIDGEPQYFIAFADDVTARRKVEDALRESEEKFSKIFRNAPIAITISTLAEGRFVEVNDTFERLSGYRREDIIGRTSKELDIWTYPDDRVRMLEELREQGPVRDFEMAMHDKAGNVFVGLLSAVVIELNGEEYLLILMKDVTARKRMEEEIEILNTDLASRAADLEAANKELEAFSYSVSHDLRKPLTNINGYCQLVLELCGDSFDERCRGFLQEIYDGTLRMNHLIDTLLGFSLLTRGELRREAVDLSGIVKEVAAKMSMDEPGRRVKFHIAEGITVNGDAKLLRVVMENLLGNAWKYSGKQEEALIEFGAMEVAGKPTYFVRDNGIGFDMGEADKLFDAFGRLSGATEFEGHGIGLAMVQRIIHRHGGHIWAEGEEGKGAAFYFSFER